MRLTKKKIIEELSSIEEISPKIVIDRFHQLLSKSNPIIRVKDRECYCTNCKKSFTTSKKIKLKTMVSCDCGNTQPLKSPKSHFDDIFTNFTYVEFNDRNEMILRLIEGRAYFNKESLEYKTDHLEEVYRFNKTQQLGVKRYLMTTLMGNIIFCEKFNKWKQDKRAWERYLKFNNIRFTDEFNYSRFKELVSSSDNYIYFPIDTILDDEKMNRIIDIEWLLSRYKDGNEFEMLIKAKKYNLLIGLYSGISTKLRHMDKNEKKWIMKHKDPTISEFDFYHRSKLEDYQLLQKLVKCRYTAHEYDTRKPPIKEINYLYNNGITVHDYFDYIDNITLVHGNTYPDSLRYPKNFKKAHDESIKDVKINKDKHVREGIISVYNSLSSLAFNEYGLIIRPVMNINELTQEGETLHHCVATYAERIASRKTSIFVIRKENDLESPLSTLELRNNEVIQCRAIHNTVPNDNVKRLVNDWCKKNEFTTCFSA